ncbi:bifunctional D-glycero-beta-D-manno-heptose-7-phosphate kinase/D-glycero-beta-D-manno-heptose 1-phosphate adenylyltransferase HldE [Gallaecimonas kandeliae]|uniref:bifunctional D-glycero-beta-D-manno-heptose-7-phosphate kinase/D-glycero-beta-D-manno-heptose 1-phosphate adenylyltransferase HldE n=1 Tax=Gallaecimonas kandeliae TaxID=3029055 RepID=UPI0026484DFF|nr:bifunctional D-glycero-beta-D-manno-heptose-7-phosphate kinase/D-glycero-beta-D-manno-heptose 1-phosphate adenylyltransferase HldE [Gallaecimonas kandeliae]WKE64745.1 bifunctional D-glycero-beta-D-manno-heptose-7-phosphate kinase/D-glycero-beta-D-manno-heptose 1-phosphate adenylyltransferase HldE [Gallaecimonas kandeliae]
MKLNLPAFENAHVLVVGDVMLDRYWHGATKRISPEAPVPVVKVEQKEDRPGGAANVALNLAALGCGVELLGLVGQDEPAQTLQDSLGSVGVKSRLQAVATHPTITKLRVLSRHQQLLRLDFEEPFADSDAQLLRAPFAVALEASKVVVLSDYAKGALADVQHLLAQARAAGKAVLVDPKGTDFERYRGATLLTPNLSEFEAVVGLCPDEQSLVERGLALIENFELEALLVTRSEHGMTLLQKGAEPVHLPATAKEVFDVTGAGDTVISTLAAALAAGAPLDQACALANIAAGIVVGKLGTSTVSTVELAGAISHDKEQGLGVLGEEQLLLAVRDAQRRGEKVVMTNGCFDILHAGHVGYLQQARALGDRLIVAVNDDDSVRRLKGDGRPVNNLERRMTVLAALGAVDWVVSFGEDTPQRLIAHVLPDLLVKGGDYKVEDIAGGAEVMANGGEVKVLGFEDGVSTTAIIERIKTR